MQKLESDLSSRTAFGFNSSYVLHIHNNSLVLFKTQIFLSSTRTYCISTQCTMLLIRNSINRNCVCRKDDFFPLRLNKNTNY